jgi:hypothetical protein
LWLPVAAHLGYGQAMLRARRETRIKIRAVILSCALLFFLMPQLVVSNPAQAANLHCAGYLPLFDGFYTDPSPQTSIEGVSANIRIEDAPLCTIGGGSYNTSSSWVLIGEGANHRVGYRGLAQVGFWRTESMSFAHPQYFYESGPDDAGTPVGWHSGDTPGVTHRFWVQWVTSGCPGGLGGCFAFNIDTTRIGVSTFNPYSVWGSPFIAASAWDMQLFGETHDASSDMSGTNAGGVATVWSGAQAQDASSDSYRAYTCNLGAANDLPSRYSLNYAANAGCGTWSTYTLQ